jgi:hypothetical protein
MFYAASLQSLIVKEDAMSERLIAPPFAEMQCRHESVARFSNDLGQEFFIVVRGYEPAQVEQLVKEIQISCKVLPDGAIDSPTKRSDQRPLDAKVTGFEILIGAISAPEIKPPYILHFEIDPPINNGEAQSYPFADGTWASVTIRAAKGTITEELWQGGGFVEAVTVDAHPRGFPPSGNVNERVDPGESTSFELKAIGGENNSRYSLNGDVRKGAYQSYP